MADLWPTIRAPVRLAPGGRSFCRQPRGRRAGAEERAAAAVRQRHRPGRWPGDGRRQVLRLDARHATVPGADRDDDERPVRPSGRPATRRHVRGPRPGPCPEAVYVDYDVIRAAPPLLNRSGLGDVLCYHTAHFDWKLARDAGREERRWPYDQRLVDEARGQLEAVLADLDEIREVTDRGIQTLMLAHRWGGAAFHDAGWNTRHMDGVDHCYLYGLEAADRPPLHPWPGRRPRERTSAPSSRTTSPEMVLSSLDRPGWTSAPRRWVSAGTMPQTAMRRLSQRTFAKAGPRVHDRRCPSGSRTMSWSTFGTGSMPRSERGQQ